MYYSMEFRLRTLDFMSFLQEIIIRKLTLKHFVGLCLTKINYLIIVVLLKKLHKTQGLHSDFHGIIYIYIYIYI